MKKHNSLSVVIGLLLLIMFVLGAIPSFAQSTNASNMKLVREYCRKHYPKQTIRVVYKYDAKKMENRKNKGVVYVERFVSYSKGRYGLSKKGEYVRYNKNVRKGKKVVSYFVYNPETNYCDDVVAVIDCGKIR